MLYTFNKCTKSIKLDFSKGYHQVLLVTDSRDLAYPASYRGVLWFSWLIVGFSAARESH